MLIYCAEFDIKSLQIINIFQYIVGPILFRAFIETVNELRVKQLCSLVIGYVYQERNTILMLY